MDQVTLTMYGAVNVTGLMFMNHEYSDRRGLQEEVEGRIMDVRGRANDHDNPLTVDIFYQGNRADFVIKDTENHQAATAFIDSTFDLPLRGLGVKVVVDKNTKRPSAFYL